jgi:hypothetical protein
MEDRARPLSTTGEGPRGLTEASIIANWLEKDDDGAYAAIVTQVSTISTEEVDRLDAAQLSIASITADIDVRRRLIKFYVVFKIAEMRRYQQFRGFPL